MNDVLIQSVRVIDLRFPTSRQSIGSDAVNKDPDYSAAYCIRWKAGAELTSLQIPFLRAKGPIDISLGNAPGRR